MATVRLNVERGGAILPHLGSGEAIVVRRASSRDALTDAIVAGAAALGMPLADLVARLSERIPVPEPGPAEENRAVRTMKAERELAHLAGYRTVREWRAAGAPWPSEPAVPVDQPRPIPPSAAALLAGVDVTQGREPDRT